ncbi:MAG: hypothetical protein KF819_40405 [Labilithrix sp.]|nr:hypothetical protein [Labilithrix sp.]
MTPRWRGIFWVVAVVNALPLFAVRHLPYTDLPEHVAAIDTLARLLPGGGGAPYVVALRESQYLLYHLTGALLARVVGDAVLANKLLLLLVAIAMPVSLRSFLRALDRDERVAIFGAMPFYNRALMVGFLPFVAAIPLTLFALAAIVEQCRAPTRRRAIGIALLCVLLFYTHVSAYVVGLLVAATIAIASSRLSRAPGRAFDPRPLLFTMPALVPSVIAALFWWSAGSLGAPGRDPDVARIALLDSVNRMPLWTFDAWRGHGDELWAVTWWTAFAIIVAAGLRRPLERGRGWVIALLPFGVALVVYLATPFRVGAAGYLNVRLAPLVTLFATVALRPRDDRWGKIPLGMAAIATVGMTATTTFEARRVCREKLGAGFESLLAEMTPGRRLAMLSFDARSPRAHEWPYVFAGSLYRARGGAIASYSFVELPHWPVHYDARVAGAVPPARGPFWVYHPCAYRYRDDGDYYDYVLVQGRFDLFPPRAPGPPFAEIASSGAFTLYARAAGPPMDEVDRGPCLRAPDPRRYDE